MTTVNVMHSNYSTFTGLKTKSSQDALLQKLGTSIPLTLETKTGQPRILCFRKHLRNLAAQVDDFLELKKETKERVSCSKVVLRFFSLHGEDLLDSLRLSSSSIKIEQDSDALVVSGEKPLVGNCVTSIREFVTG